MQKKKLVHHCKYCGEEFTSEKRLIIHEERECPLNPSLFGNDEKPFGLLKFMGFATLIVVAMVLFVFSPMILYPFLLNFAFEEPYNYLALIIFWALILGFTAAAGIVDHLKKRRTR